MSKISRRTFIKVAGAAAATLKAADVPQADAATGASTPAPHAQSATQSVTRRTTYTFLNAQEAAFIEAAVARLIPTDDTGPGATEAAVANYIDKQLAGAWGAG